MYCYPGRLGSNATADNKSNKSSSSTVDSVGEHPTKCGSSGVETPPRGRLLVLGEGGGGSDMCVKYLLYLTCGGRACNRGKEAAYPRMPSPSSPPPPLATRWTLPMIAFRALCLRSPRVRRADRIGVTVRDGDAGWVWVTALGGTDTRRRQLAGETSRASATAVTRMVLAVFSLSLARYRGSW